MSLTGGALSPYALLLPAGVALSWHCEGKAGGALLRASARSSGAPRSSTLGRAADLRGRRTSSRRRRRARRARRCSSRSKLARSTAPATDATGNGDRRRSRRTAPAAARPRRGAPPRPAERVGATARPRSSTTCAPRSRSSASTRTSSRKPRGAASCPNAEYLANLAREIELAERLVGAPRARRPTTARRLEPPQNADLVEILGSLATAYRLAHGGRIRIEFIAERPQLPVAADPVALQRAFRNVLDNAIKYTPEGGEVRIRAGAAGPHAFVVVKDTGMGMSPEERTRAPSTTRFAARAPSPPARAARASASR